MAKAIIIRLLRRVVILSHLIIPLTPVEIEEIVYLLRIFDNETLIPLILGPLDRLYVSIPIHFFLKNRLRTLESEMEKWNVELRERSQNLEMRKDIIKKKLKSCSAEHRKENVCDERQLPHVNLHKSDLNDIKNN